MQIMEKINSRIDSIINDLNLTNVEFGQALGVTEATARNLRKTGVVKNIYIEIISTKWGYSKNWIKTGEGNMRIKPEATRDFASINKLAVDCVNNWDRLLEDPLFKARMENEARKLAYEMTPSIVEKFREEWEKNKAK